MQQQGTRCTAVARTSTPSAQRSPSAPTPAREQGTADELLAGADVYLGLSGPGAVSAAAVRTMASGAVVFAMANPTPEVQPEDVSDHVRIMATGRSDYPNQINNVLAFPGVFRGALDVRATTINEEMKLAAARAIASIVSDDELDADYIIPSAFNRDVAPAVAEQVAEAAERSGVARRHVTAPVALRRLRQVGVALAQIPLEQLAARVLRQAVDDDDVPRGLEAGQPRRQWAMTASGVSEADGFGTTAATTASIQRGSATPKTATSATSLMR